MDDPLGRARSITAAELGLSMRRAMAVVGVLPRGPRLAVVGSRAALRARVAAVDTIVAVAAAQGWSLVSGGALGIDAAAHRVALRIGMPQAAVLPLGSDQPYPPGNVGLFEDIARAGGAVLFGRPAGSPANRGVFLSRNAVVVGLADRVVVAQAGLRSGSGWTGRHALAAGRPVAVLAGQAGTADLVTRGATALPFPADAATLAHGFEAWLRDAPVAPTPWPADLQDLRDALTAAGARGLAIDAATPAQILALVRAEAEGLVVQRTPGRYVATR